jgi:hypothetical protein
MRNLPLEQPPVFNVEALQYPALDCLTALHQLRHIALTLFGLLVLARVVGDVDGDHDVCLLLLQTKEDEVYVDILWHLLAVRWINSRRLDEAQSVDWFVAA